MYGIVLTIVGIIGETPEQIAKSGGLALNLWTGLVMLVVGIIFYIWAFMKPPLPPEVDTWTTTRRAVRCTWAMISRSCIPTRWSAVSDATATATDRPRKDISAPREGGADVRSGPVTAQCRWSDA